MDNNKDRLVLTDGTEIALEGSQGIGTLFVCTPDRKAASNLWEQLTQENLAEIAVVSFDGVVSGTYKNMLLDYITGADNADDTTLLTIHLREKTENEILKEKVAALEAEVQTHSGAISDLGQTVSDMATEGSIK